MSRQNRHHLPAEILSDICERSKIVDAHNISLASKACADFCAKVLFRRIYLSPKQRDIECFEHITSNPNYLKHVEELIYDDSAFNGALRDLASFYSLTERHPDGCIHDSPEYPEHAADAANKRRWYEETEAACRPDSARVEAARMQTALPVFEWVSARVTEYFRNRAANRDGEALRAALARGLKIKRLMLTSLPAGPDYDDRPDGPVGQPSRSPAVRQLENELPEHRGLVPLQEILPRVDWTTLTSHLPVILDPATDLLTYSVYGTGPPISRWQADRDTGHAVTSCYHHFAVMAPYRGLSLLMQQFEASPTKPSEFLVIPSRKPHPSCQQDTEASMSAAVFLAPSPPRQMLTNLIGQLKVLHLTLGAVVHPDGSVYDYQQLKAALQGARSLESLYLHIVDHQDLAIPTLFRDLRFARLRRLHVSDLSFTDRDLFAFVHQHARCLRHLTVFYCRLFDGNGDDGNAWWWPLLDELRRQRCFDGMRLYLNKLREMPGPDLEMAGNPERDEGVAVWESWVAGQAPFPLLATTGSYPNDHPYRKYLREALPR